MEDALNGLFKKPNDAGMDSLFKKPTNTGVDSLFKKPEPPKVDSLFKAPKLQNSDPRNGLSSSQIAEAEANKKAYHKTDNALATVLPIPGSDAVAFGKGFTHNMDEYGASINKGLGKLSKAILPEKYQTSFFEDNAKYWNDNRKMNEIETEDNKVAHFTGELVNDPVNLMGVGLVTKGKKLARVGKSMATGAGVGASIGLAKSYGNDSLTSKQTTDHVAMSAGFVSVLNGVIAGLTKGKVTNAIKDVEHLTGSAREEADHAIQGLLDNPEAFGMTAERATKLSEEYQALLKDNTGRSSRLPIKDEAVQVGDGNAPDFVTHGKPEDVSTGGLDQKGSFMLNRLLKNVEGRSSELPQAPSAKKSYKQEDGSFDWEAYGGEHPDSKIFDAQGRELDMPVPQPRPELLREKSRIEFAGEDKLDDMFDFSPQEIAKVEEGMANKSHLSDDAEGFIAGLDNKLSKSRNSTVLEFRNLIKSNPLALRAIDTARNRYAKDTYSPTSGGSAGSWIDPNTGLVARAGNKGGQNANFDFSLTKSDINKLVKGEVTPEVLNKLKTDMSRFEQDPMFAEAGQVGKFQREQYAIAHENLSTAEKTVSGEQQSLGFEGTQNALFDTGSSTQLQVPSWAKSIVSDTVRYEDVVKAITDAKNGKHTELADRALDAMSKDEKLAEKLNPQQDPNTLFSNAQHSLAGGFGGGVVNAGNGMFDEGDTADKMADRFIQGMIAGVAGVQGLKALRKTNPEAFKKVQSWVMDNNVKAGDKLPTEGVQLGVFAGKKAKGFEGKTTHKGKYDGQTRFEIDDSAMSVHNKGVVELSQKGYVQLDKLIKHDELFSNYPQLRNVVVKFDKNMESHATFDGEGTITLSNKFKNKDEMSSSIIHEIQHWVQNKEGFAGGGNFEDMMMQVQGKIYSLEKKGELSELDAMNYKNDLDYLKENPSAEAFDKYKKIAGEIEAREVQARKNLTPEERELIPNYENAETMTTGHSDEAYNSAFMAKLEGRHGEFDSTGIKADDATLDFSRNKSDNSTGQVIDDGVHDFAQTEQLAKEKNSKDWTDLSKTDDGVKNFGKLMKQLFTDTMSATYHTAREGLHVQKNKSDAQIGRVAKVLSTIDKDTRVLLHQYMTKQNDGATLPPKVKAMGDMVRKTIDDMSNELVRAGQLDDVAHKEWKDAYLARLYEPKMKDGFGLGSAGNKTLDKTGERGLSQEFKASDLKGMTGWLNKNGFLSDAELQTITSAKQMEAFMKSDQRAGLLREGKLSITHTVGGKIKLRRDWTKAERESMGEVEDALMTIPETLARMNKLKQHSDFLKDISKLDGAVVDNAVVKKATPQELKDAGYKHLEVDARYGALSGKWLRNDVADDIGVMHKDINQLAGWGEQKWMGYHGLWKKSKTVWNPTAHVNNTVGNWGLMHMAGMNSSQMPKILNRGRVQINALARVEELETKVFAGTLSGAEKTELAQLKLDSKFALEAKDNGIFGKSQLNDILAGVNEGTKTGLLGKADEFASKWYQLEDNFNRLSFYITLRETGRDAKLSKQMVDFMLPDYSKPLPKGWRVARDTSVAPFISWSYYTMPSIIKALGGNKGAKGFGKFSRGQKSVAKVMGLLSLMEYTMSDGTVTPLDNLPFYDGNKPEDFKGRRYVIGKDGDTLRTLKTDRMLPYAELKDPVNYLKSQVSGLLPNLIYTLNGQKMYDGRPITYKNKSGVDKTVDWMKYLAKQYAPVPMPIMNGIDAIDASLRSKNSRKRNDVIKPRSTAQELLKNIGLNTISYSKRGAERENKRH